MWLPFLQLLVSGAEQEGVVVDACEDIPKSFLLCDHPYHRQIVYLSQLGSRTLMSRAEEREGTGEKPWKSL